MVPRGGTRQASTVRELVRLVTSRNAIREWFIGCVSGSGQGSPLGTWSLEDGRAHPLVLCEFKNVIPVAVSGRLTAMWCVLIERTALPYGNALTRRVSEKGPLLRLDAIPYRN